MAYNKGEYLRTRIKWFSRITICAKILKFFFFFYSFLSFFFWFLNSLEIRWLYLFNWIFIIPYKMVASFYSPAGADFSLAIIGIVFLILGLIFHFISDNLYPQISEMQESLAKYLEQKKNVRPKRVKPIPGGGGYPYGSVFEMNEIYESSFWLLFIIQPHIHKIKNQPSDLELTFQEVELWRQRVNKRILDNIKYSEPIQKGYYRKNLFLVYKDFNYVDDFIYYIRPTIESIVQEFHKYGIELQFNYVLSSISQISALEKELDLMDTILSLNFINTFILTNRFKKAYDIKNVKRYVPALKGEYNLSKNLAISNIQPLYEFRDAQNEVI